MVEQAPATRIVNITFGIPVLRNQLRPDFSPRDLEVRRACFNGEEKLFTDGVYVLDEADPEMAKKTRTKTQLTVKDGIGTIKIVHDGAREDTEELYGNPETRLERPGQAYYSHQMKDGEVKSLVACRVALP